jgi:hypothetical protein
MGHLIPYLGSRTASRASAVPALEENAPRQFLKYSDIAR